MGKSFAPPIALDMVAQGIRYSKELWDAYATKKTANVGCLRFFNVFFSNLPSVVTRSNGLKKNRKRVKNKELEY